MAANETPTTSENITIVLNGESRALPAPASVATLLEHFAYPSRGIAIAVNRQVVPRSGYTEQSLAESDVVDVIQAVGGG